MKTPRNIPPKGQILVEFALVFPLFLLTFLGFLQMHLLFQAKAGLHHASYAAARSYATNASLSSASNAALAIWSAALGGTTNLEVSVTQTSNTTLGLLCSATVSTDYSLLGIAFLNNLLASTNSPPGTFRMTSSCAAPMNLP